MYLILLLFVVIVILILLLNSETFVVGSNYTNRNYEGGANLIRGDLPIEPIQQSWFNTPYGPSNLAPSFMEF